MDNTMNMNTDTDIRELDLDNDVIDRDDAFDSDFYSDFDDFYDTI